MDHIESEYFASLLHKLETNQSLSEKDFNYISHFFEQHSECSIGHISLVNQCIQVDVPEEKSSSKKNFVDQDTQCQLPIETDYEELEKMINKQWRLSPELRNYKTINELSVRLFPYRRPVIIRQKISARVALALYPYLFSKEQIFSELELVAQKDKMFQTFMTNVEQFSDAILSNSSETSFKKKLLRDIESIEDKTEKQQICNAASLLLLSTFMDSEDRKSFIIFNSEAVPKCDPLLYIYFDKNVVKSLQSNTTPKLYFDDYELCSVNNIQEAYFGLLAAYATFNLKYPKACYNTLCLLQRLYLEFPKNSDKVGKKLQSKLNFLMQHKSNK